MTGGHLLFLPVCLTPWRRDADQMVLRKRRAVF